jgi:hypothetical protein
MTDTTEPDPKEEPTPAAEARDTADDAGSAPERKSGWSALNRTNRIAAIVLGGVAAVFVAAAIFGAGVIVGAEFSTSEGHHHGEEKSDYRDGGDEASGEHGWDGGYDTHRDGGYDGESGGQGDQTDSDQHLQPERPQSPLPATPKP